MKPFAWRHFSLFIALGFAVSGANLQSQETKEFRDELEDAVLASFEKVSEGWSVDELLLRDDRRQVFLETVRGSLKDSLSAKDAEVSSDREIFSSLLALRKRGEIKIEATKRDRSNVEEVLHVSEIAARSIEDQTKKNFDQVLVDPELLKRFDEIARELSPEVDLYLVRKGALRLRKSRKLKPELVTRVGDWKKTIVTYSAEELRGNSELLPARPAIYIFRDKTGYLYIGQSVNVRERMANHLDQSDRLALGSYLEQRYSSIQVEVHLFGEGSPAEDTTIRKAYESELIRSRAPRLNIAP